MLFVRNKFSYIFKNHQVFYEIIVFEALKLFNYL